MINFFDMREIKTNHMQTYNVCTFKCCVYMSDQKTEKNKRKIA